MPKSLKIELNPLFKKTLQLMEKTKRNVFVTGRAGTGKSTLLQLFRRTTKKKVIVLAPTGVAAVNVQGQTIHSFFGFKPDITPSGVKKINPRRKNLYKKLEIVIIDEISMVRADLLDCVNAFLQIHGPKKKQPFGGVQMIFFGDLYQLPPVVTGREREIFKTHYPSPYFFDAHCFADLNMELIELEKVYRQTDQNFIDLLNSIRNNSAQDAELARINARLDANFQFQPDNFYIYLTTTNAMAAKVNQQQLQKLKTKEFYSQGIIKGKFDQKYLPTDIDLKVKIGAQIMMLNNDSQGRWINGTIGKIIDIEEDKESGDDVVIVELSNNEICEVYPYTWEVFEYKFNQMAGEIEAESVGSFAQYPLKLAWAITIHKSQGKTFDKVILDIGRGTFAHGQLYTALSRCVSLEGLVLKQPLYKRHIWMDWRVVNFVTKYQYALSDKKCSLKNKIALIEKAIAGNSILEITYLKSDDVKSKRKIKPQFIGQLEYSGKPFLGIEAFCLMRKQDRVFRVDRILEMQVVEG
jgi:ATP-dependent exoDNAse (exonuclease V) alpha subunit